jgi:hypothetical protein
MRPRKRVPMTNPQDQEIDDILSDYATAWSGYDSSDGKPIFAKRMEDVKQRLNDLITRARIDELMPIDNINRRLGDDFGEMDAQEEIEKHVDSRLATLTATKEEEPKLVRKSPKGK